jgi:undecaprenyl-diphosphatase
MSKLAKAAYLGGALATFGVLATRVRSGKTSELDARITRKLQTIEDPTFDKVMHTVSWPGFPPQSRIIPWALPLAMLAAGKPLEAIFQLAGWGTGGISGLVKRIMKRPRPTNDGFRVSEARISGSSFPSGHVIIYTGVYGFLAYLAHCHIKIGLLRKAIIGGLASMIALVGPSRIYLGHHWFSDVVASYLLGTSYLVVLTSIYQRMRRKRTV